MGSLHLNLPTFSSPSLVSNSNLQTRTQQFLKVPNPTNMSKAKRIRSLELDTKVPITDQEITTTSATEQEPPSIDFAFVSSRLLPDGTPDIQIRSACGGQKLRDIMLESNIDLYGPYGRLLLNCGGGGTCATCLVEVLQGKEMLSPKTEKEKEALKRRPKTWRLACQTMVGQQDSRGEVVIQQLPEWKAHEWRKQKD